LGITASAVTVAFIPEPSGDQTPVVGSHAAMRDAATPPAVTKSPPTTRRGWAGPAPSGSNIVVAHTSPLTPGR
jgi:hypothetical protein